MTEDELRKKIEEILETKINPAVAGHGGMISLAEIKGKKVYVNLTGGCQGCGMAQVTLKQGVERTLREAIPEIEEVLDAAEA